ncbi:hypothetical protein Pcinc_021137 [Petrolisthes cinctipes]|uniref:Uncharacterized protein n=1 Tax=Petrolisthes cinctipes TaxID=88211 RepID=A0AAE1KFH1_PETCI|nr:hypothetical protein Pcinc_021137 [Petrolisthes cinctipes]
MSLQQLKVAIVLNKCELPLSRSANEVLNVMRLEDLKQHARPKLLTFEVSALPPKGLRPLLKWMRGIE